jgi:hypothetical protein
MKKTTIIQVFLLFFILLLLFSPGCDPQTGGIAQSPKSDNIFGRSASFADYTPQTIEIMPLTGFVTDKEDVTRINVFVSMLDVFNSQLKSPAVFRFELYERIQYSTEPKGKRIKMWPDVDLADAVENNKYWRDFLRTYEFNLDFKPDVDQSYILEVTCLCPDGKRLTGEYIIKTEK